VSSTIVVSGTGTGVGKTVVTAAIAALALSAGDPVSVVKPVQTGLAAGEPTDLDEITRLAGIPDADRLELARYRHPLSPEAAARVEGAPCLGLETAVDAVLARSRSGSRVLVEGAGGLLVRYDPSGWTIADLAAALRAPVLLVVHAALGTLNHTALSIEALDRRGLGLAGVVIGSWPTAPDLACRTNIADLEALASGPLAGALPAGAAALTRARFLRAAGAGLAPSLGGTFDAADFRRRYMVELEG